MFLQDTTNHGGKPLSLQPGGTRAHTRACVSLFIGGELSPSWNLWAALPRQPQQMFPGKAAHFYIHRTRSACLPGFLGSNHGPSCGQERTAMYVAPPGHVEWTTDAQQTEQHHIAYWGASERCPTILKEEKPLGGSAQGFQHPKEQVLESVLPCPRHGNQRESEKPSDSPPWSPGPQPAALSTSDTPASDTCSQLLA